MIRTIVFFKYLGHSLKKIWEVNCWADAICNYIDKLIKNKENRIEIRTDILKIQVVFTDKLFQNPFRTEWPSLTKNKGNTQVFLEGIIG